MHDGNMHFINIVFKILIFKGCLVFQNRHLITVFNCTEVMEIFYY